MTTTEETTQNTVSAVITFYNGQVTEDVKEATLKVVNTYITDKELKTDEQKQELIFKIGVN